MNINLNVFIKKETKRLNALFELGSKRAGKTHTPFLVEDYAYLKESQEYFGLFSLPYFLSYAVLKDIEYRIDEPIPGDIWYWKKDADTSKTKGFLLRQFRLMHETLHSYLVLLKTKNYLQALIIFRSYIEYSSQLYACILDYEFFDKYTQNDLLDEDYKKLWFSNLKPAKVLSKIKSINTEIDQLLKENKITYRGNAVYRRDFKPFDSKLRGFLYSDISALAHGSYPALLENDENRLYALVFLCSSYLVESQTVIDELASVYYKYSLKELFTKWITVEVYQKSREPGAVLDVK